MKKALNLLALAALLCGFGIGPANAADTKILPERSLGKPSAPVTIVEYASLTCSHCADFYNDIMPELEKLYVDTGKVRFIYKDFPIDGISLKGAAIANCMPADRFYPFIKTLFKNQKTWMSAPKPDAAILQFAQMAGLEEAKAKACIEDTATLDALVDRRTKAMEKYEIQATPTFIVNDGEDKIVGALSLKDFTTVIDKVLSKRNKAATNRPSTIGE